MLACLTECSCANEVCNSWRCAQVEPEKNTRHLRSGLRAIHNPLPEIQSSRGEWMWYPVKGTFSTALLLAWHRLCNDWVSACMCVCPCTFRFISFILSQLKADIPSCSGITLSLRDEGPNFGNEMIFVVSHKMFIFLMDNMSFREVMSQPSFKCNTSHPCNCKTSPYFSEINFYGRKSNSYHI